MLLILKPRNIEEEEKYQNYWKISLNYCFLHSESFPCCFFFLTKYPFIKSLTSSFPSLFSFFSALMLASYFLLVSLSSFIKVLSFFKLYNYFDLGVWYKLPFRSLSLFFRFEWLTVEVTKLLCWTFEFTLFLTIAGFVYEITFVYDIEAVLSVIVNFYIDAFWFRILSKITFEFAALFVVLLIFLQFNSVPSFFSYSNWLTCSSSFFVFNTCKSSWTAWESLGSKYFDYSIALMWLCTLMNMSINLISLTASPW